MFLPPVLLKSFPKMTLPSHCDPVQDRFLVSLFFFFYFSLYHLFFILFCYVWTRVCYFNFIPLLRITHSHHVSFSLYLFLLVFLTLTFLTLPTIFSVTHFSSFKFLWFSFSPGIYSYTTALLKATYCYLFALTSEGGSRKFLWNVGMHLQNYTTSYFTRPLAWMTVMYIQAQ